MAAMMFTTHLGFPTKRAFSATARPLVSAVARHSTLALETPPPESPLPHVALNDAPLHNKQPHVFRPGPGGTWVPSENTRYHCDSVCFGCGPANPHGLNMHAYRVRKTETDAASGMPDVVSLWRAEPGLHQGYHGIVHGGVLGALVDCLGCWTVTSHVHAKAEAAAAAAGLPAKTEGNVTMTMGLNVKFKKPTLMPLVPLRHDGACTNDVRAHGACAHDDVHGGADQPRLEEMAQEHATFWAEADPAWVDLLPASTLLMTSKIVPDASSGKKYRVESRVYDLYQLGGEGANALRVMVASAGVAHGYDALLSTKTRFGFDVALLDAVVNKVNLFFGAESELAKQLDRTVTVECEGDYFHKADVATHVVTARKKVLGLA